MHIRSDLTVDFPIEYFVEWMKGRAISDGVIYDNSEIIVDSISYDNNAEYLTVNAHINTRLDS